MANLSTLAPITTTATALSNLVLVSPQATVGYQPNNYAGANQNQAPPPALIFHYEGEQTALIESDITDHYVEDNTAIQDQWALKPEIITTHGFIGELNDIAPAALVPLLTAANKLLTIAAYVPEISETAIIAYDEAFLLYQVSALAKNAAVSGWNSMNSQQGESIINSAGLWKQPNQSKQQVMFQQFYGYWKNRILFSIQTPWAIFQNMAIMSLRAIQDAETNVITDFEVKFKMIRNAQATAIPVAILQGRALIQSSELIDLGTSTPVDSISFLSGMGSNYPGVLGA